MKEEEIKQIGMNLIQKNNVALISTINDAMYPTVCAIIKLKADGLKTLYFSSNRSSEKVQNILKNPKGSVYFYDAMEYTGLTLTGKFEILEKDALQVSDVVYPEGLRTEDYVIIAFHADKMKLYYSMEKYEYPIF